MKTAKQLYEALVEAALWASWQNEVLDAFNAYAERFGAQAGANVFRFVLHDALAYRGLTSERFYASLGCEDCQERVPPAPPQLFGFDRVPLLDGAAAVECDETKIGETTEVRLRPGRRLILTFASFALSNDALRALICADKARGWQVRSQHQIYTFSGRPCSVNFSTKTLEIVADSPRFDV